MRKIAILLAAGMLVFAACGTKAKTESGAPGKAQTAKAASGELKPQTLCPVTNEPVSRKVFVDFQGQRIYFCNDGCAAAFLKDPEKYMQVIADSGILLESIQTTCPVMGSAIDKSIFRDYKGRRVYFCCSMCPPEFDKDPEGVMRKLPGSQPPMPQRPGGEHEGHSHEGE